VFALSPSGAVAQDILLDGTKVPTTPCGAVPSDLLSPAGQNSMIGKHIALTLVVGGAWCTLLWRRPPDNWTALRIVGLVLMVAGFVLWTIARFQLGASFAVRAKARKLVTHGLYARIRNPIYLFGSWVLAGAMLIFGKPVWLLVFVALIPVQIWRARKESAVLEAAFGEQYRKYRAGTWF
jgi:protein-S-isoprenylcysteine O-methyltransferase Ste14